MKKTLEQEVFDYFKKRISKNCHYFDKKYKFTFPIGKDCSKKTINSHSMPKNTLLRVEKRNNLYQIHYLYILNNDNTKPVFQKVTVNSGMFYNFLCANHDYEIFKNIENPKIYGKNNYNTDEQKFLFCLKALFYTVSYCDNFLIYFKEKTKKVLKKNIKSIKYLIENEKNIEKEILVKKIKKIYGISAKDLDVKMKEDNFTFGTYICDKIIKKLSESQIEFKLTEEEYLNFISDLLKSYRTNNYKIFIDTILKTNNIYRLILEKKKTREKLLVKMEQIYKNKDYSKIKTKIYKVPYILPVISSSIPYITNSDDVIFFSLFPDGNQTICLISYFAGNQWFDHLISQIILKYKKKNIIFNLSMLGNNVIFTDEFLYRLGNKKDEFLKDRHNFPYQKEKFVYEKIFTDKKREKYQIF